MRERNRWRLILAGAFLAPMTVIKATELYLAGSMPREAGAASSSASPAVIDPLIPELLSKDPGDGEAVSEPERQLIDYIEQVRRRPHARSPLERFTAVDAPAEEDRPAPKPQAPPLNVTVQAVMRSSGGNIVLINGVSRRVGETIDDGRGADGHWIIREIDPASRTVTFEHSSGDAIETRTVLQQ